MALQKQDQKGAKVDSQIEWDRLPAYVLESVQAVSSCADNRKSSAEMDQEKKKGQTLQLQRHYDLETVEKQACQAQLFSQSFGVERALERVLLSQRAKIRVL